MSQDDTKPRSRAGAFARLGVIVALGTGLFLLWRFTSLGEMLDPERLTELADQFSDHPLAGPTAIAVFAIGCTLMVPITPMVLGIATVFEAPMNVFYALTGAMLGSIPTFWIGRVLGKDAINRLGSERIRRFNKLLARRGMIACAVIRIVPVAPFTVVNMLIGASEVKFRDYLIGTMIGIIPAIVGISVFGTQLTRVIENPTPTSIGILAGVAIAILLGATLLRRWVASQTERTSTSMAPVDPDEHN